MRSGCKISHQLRANWMANEILISDVFNHVQERDESKHEVHLIFFFCDTKSEYLW